MKELPISFTAPMIRALLDGSKNQTRRIVKKPRARDSFVCIDDANGWWPYQSDDGESSLCDDGMEHPYNSPYGTAGDRLWVREAWTTHAFLDREPPRDLTTRSIHYVADGKIKTGKYRQSFHMPRWASRILLDVVSVRVEHLQEITAEDAINEGLTALQKGGGQLTKYGIPDRDGMPGNDDDGWHWHEWEKDPRAAYRKLWEQINGQGSWDENPLVWVVEFKGVQA